jgi:hypothetical protein
MAIRDIISSLQPAEGLRFANVCELKRHGQPEQ